MMRNLHIAIQEHIIFCINLLQGTVIAFSKAEILLQHDGLHLRKLSLQKVHRTIRRRIVCHPDFSILTGIFDDIRKILCQHLLTIPV